jgi:pyruvate formate lyase activating enzyme
LGRCAAVENGGAINAVIEHPLVFDIRRFALDDGPGIRTTVFLKGCALACPWCQNPEGIRPGAELAYDERRCIRCGQCEAACAPGAIVLGEEVALERGSCTLCGRCAEICPSGALRVIGRAYSPDELTEALLRDAVFYHTSGGGVTFSGGEPLLWPGYLAAVLSRLKDRGVHTAIETAGTFALDTFRELVLGLVDLVYFDLKVLDSGRHRALIGAPNEGICENLTALLAMPGTRVVVRVPLVPGMTATRENLSQIADFLRGAGCQEWDLVPYAGGGVAKRRILGQPDASGLPATLMSAAEEERWRRLFCERLGGGTT